jgi:exopolyphosphatase/guanosine-5'-triphosphate,3'-diphosphate pyrophosphatase
MARKKKHDRGRIAGADPLGAIIDIGSNTVRLVIYGGPPRAPTTLFNEKVTARLGRDLDENSLLADESIDLAMSGLERFALMLADLEIKKVDTVATAAVRDAENGKEFLARVSSLGLEPRLLSGLDEAECSAQGVLGAFPSARGIVADIGGGSLELVPVDEGKIGEGCSLPVGPAWAAGTGTSCATSSRRSSARRPRRWCRAATSTSSAVPGVPLRPVRGRRPTIRSPIRMVSR